ncbi:MAG: RpiB/LacA/LacB family sugar-phosphate isomerase [Chloroflexi bacterium]|nr:MAG: RpiB/LacA/LacB family sugar-phosphate isomerase [Chloroflexota bacterium]
MSLEFLHACRHRQRREDAGHPGRRRVPAGQGSRGRAARAVERAASGLGRRREGGGAGVSIAANKGPGVRAALCADAETARGARRWNDANVLVMSLRATPEAVAREICDAWLEGGPDPAEKAVIDKVKTIEEDARHGVNKPRR